MVGIITAVVSLPDDAAAAEAVPRARKKEVDGELEQEGLLRLTSVARPNLIVDGKLDHSATTDGASPLPRNPVAQGPLRVTYEIKTTGRRRRRNWKIPKFWSYSRGRDQDMLVERNAELLKALEHIALRWLYLDPQF